MHHQLKRAAITKSNGRKVADVARRQPADAERFRECHDRAIHQAEGEIGELSVDSHRTSELARGRRCVGEGAAGEILHEHLHRPALIAKEVVDFRQDETWNETGPCLVNRSAKRLVVRRALDEVVDERSGVANEGRGATGGH